MADTDTKTTETENPTETVTKPVEAKPAEAAASAPVDAIKPTGDKNPIEATANQSQSANKDGAARSRAPTSSTSTENASPNTTPTDPDPEVVKLAQQLDQQFSQKIAPTSFNLSLSKNKVLVILFAAGIIALFVIWQLATS